MKTADYLAAVKAKRNITTDYKLAKALGISTQLAYKYSHGLSIPGPLVAFKVAEILGDQPAAVIADFEAERAERMGKEDDADAWRTITKKLVGGLSSILLVAGLGGIGNADAGLRDPSAGDGNTHREKRRKKARPFDGLMPCAAFA